MWWCWFTLWISWKLRCVTAAVLQQEAPHTDNSITSCWGVTCLNVTVSCGENKLQSCLFSNHRCTSQLLIGWTPDPGDQQWDRWKTSRTVFKQMSQCFQQFVSVSVNPVVLCCVVFRYMCYCGKLQDPPADPWLAPHSCGSVCQKELKPSCGHTCLLLCHPGNQPLI